MDPMIVQYALFILVALCIIGAVVALNRWLYRYNKPNVGGPITWAKLDIKQPETREEMLTSAVLADDDDDEEEAELHVRAKQNGHHVNGHKPLI